MKHESNKDIRGSGLAREGADSMHLMNKSLAEVFPIKRSTSLTLREVEVLTWVAHGKSAWEIGEILEITKRTVDEHVQSAVKKVGAGNRTHAVAIALRDGIINFS